MCALLTSCTIQSIGAPIKPKADWSYDAGAHSQKKTVRIGASGKFFTD
ncbi:hypothetical protein HYY70_00880 [Candidatus Woesearchaeota archaeon]|nr:hypothetical protein [Candidatus Woesearchaeota archaeon]